MVNNSLNFNKYIFRDYDIRGVIGKDFNSDFAISLAIALDKFYPKGSIVLSRDLRQSGIEVLKKMNTILQKKGRKIINIGENPTPLMYYAIVKKNAIGGVQVTASHKPSEWNGFKINSSGAECVDGEKGIYDICDLILNNHDEENIESLETENQEADEALDSEELESPVTKVGKELREEYVKEITNKIKLNENKKLKVIIDNGNGTVGLLLQEIFEKMGVEVKTIFSELDDSFPNHIPDPHVDAGLKFLTKEVVKEKADLGIALDGDGDRCGIVDEIGQIVSKDKTLMLLAFDALNQFGKGNIVCEVRASMAYLDFVKENGGNPIMAKAGHSFVLRKVKETDAVFGGELTGHMYFPKEFYDFDDAMFTACKLVQIVSNFDVPLSKHLESLPEYMPSEEFVFDVPDEVKFEKIERIVNLVKDEGKDVLDIDGARITYPNIGWLLIRASNTGPKIKCRFEAKNKNDFEFLHSELKRLLEFVNVEI